VTSLSPILRDRLIAIGASLIAVLLGYQVAVGNLILPSIVLAGGIILGLHRIQTLPLQNVILAGLLVGYFVGNRGFAQLTPTASLPLLPGEAALAALVFIQILNRVTSKSSPRGLSGLDWGIGVWVIIGTIRFLFDFRTYGFVAVRDFATVYYAAYFYLAYNLSAGRREVASLLLTTIRVSASILLPTYLIYLKFPEFFSGTFTFRGIPLIYYKDDLVAAYFAVGSVLHYFRFHEHRTKRNLILALLLAGGVMITNNRAAALGLIVAASWMIVGGRWRYSAYLGIAGILAAIALVINAERQFETWRDTPLLDVYERAASIFDPTGQMSYSGENTFNKGDNNLFRTVWWEVAITETIDENPVGGLGFGHDLASGFLREFYADAPDDFTARSPHSILVTVFARMGAIGFLAFLGIIAQIIRATWKARHLKSDQFSAWCGAWVLLTSACFGVVLEGPMGAIPFWILLGLAQGESERLKDSAPDEIPKLTEGTAP
jgi:hypothetical protein